MAHQSLYRRYRPRRFDEVRGQGHVVDPLRNAVAGATQGHAYLFSGPRGTGKTSTARILAKALNCENLQGGEPCCDCSSCVSFEEGRSFDLFELDAASHRGVEDMRDLVSKAIVSSPGRTKVYILDEVHMLTDPASATLLKTLEEPPEGVCFVLATTDPHKVIPTIRSRTQHYEFQLLSADELERQVRWIVDDAELGLDDASVAWVVQRGRGSSRDTLSALDQVAAAGGIVERPEPVAELYDALVASDTGAAIVAVAESLAQGHEPRQLAEAFLDSLRDVFLVSLGVDVPALLSAERERCEAWSAQLGTARLTRAMEAVGSALVDMRNAADARIPLEVALVRLTAAGDGSLDGLAARVDALESALAGGAPSDAGTAAPRPGPAAAATVAEAAAAPADADASTPTTSRSGAGPAAARAALARLRSGAGDGDAASAGSTEAGAAATARPGAADPDPADTAGRASGDPGSVEPAAPSAPPPQPPAPSGGASRSSSVPPPPTPPAASRPTEPASVGASVTSGGSVSPDAGAEHDVAAEHDPAAEDGSASATQPSADTAAERSADATAPGPSDNGPSDNGPSGSGASADGQLDPTVLADALQTAVLPQLKALGRAVFKDGTFGSTDERGAVFELAQGVPVEHAERSRPDVESALAAHLGRPVTLRIVASGAAPPASVAGGAPPRIAGGAVDLAEPATRPDTRSSGDGTALHGGHDEVDESVEIDLTELTDATDVAESGIERLTRAFPGAELIDEDEVAT